MITRSASTDRRFTTGMALSMLLSVAACAGEGGPIRPATDGRITQCKAGDRQIDSERDCLQDDAACYALSNGGWCTGERGSTCPSGSTPVPAGTGCPPGARCFDYSEGLSCAISVN